MLTEERQPALRGLGQRPGEGDLLREMTAGPVDRVEAAERPRVTERAAIGGDPDRGRHVPHASEHPRARELVEEPPQQERVGRVPVHFPRPLRRRRELVPAPLAIALDDLEHPVAERFRTVIPGRQPRGGDEEQAAVRMRPAPVQVDRDMGHEHRLAPAEVDPPDPPDASRGAVPAPADARRQVFGVDDLVTATRPPVRGHQVRLGHALGVVQLDRLHGGGGLRQLRGPPCPVTRTGTARWAGRRSTPGCRCGRAR